MQIDLAVVCDYALLDQGGKMSILGVFDVMGGPKYPLTQPRLFVCLRLGCRSIESGTNHTLALAIHDADGNQLAHAGGPFQVGRAVLPGAPISVQAMLQFVGVTFPHPGQYSVEIAVDNNHLKSIPLVLAVAGAQPAAATG
jgi:hypothetical protein